VSDLTRRELVKNSAMAAAGMTVIGAIAADVANADTGAAGSDPVVAYVSNPNTGEISLMHGEREVKLHDRKLARDIARAAR